jgi:AcrR family transcriptional regulator
MDFVKKPRKRRGAEEARRLILEAAEKRLAEAGPGGIRLQQIAEDVGVSHPAILHHFGSREGLVHAVVERALVDLQADLVKALQPADGSLPDGAKMLDAVSNVLADRGYGRLLAWLVLSDYDGALDIGAVHANWKAITDANHSLRLAAGAKADYEDTQFTVLLAALAMFGQAIAGKSVFRMAGLDPRKAQKFRGWLANVLAAHMAAGT